MINAVSPMAKYKLVFLGDIYVGKTCIINRFMYETFDHAYQPTIGIDFLSKTMYLEDRTVRLQLWDTAGQERFRSLIPSYIRDSSVAVIVYDVTNKQSFANVNKWADDVRAERGTNVIIVLVANKIDKVEERYCPLSCVSSEEGTQKGKELEAIHVEVSAKTGDNIKNLFRRIAQVLPSNDSVPRPAENAVKLSDPEVPKPGEATATEQKKANCKC